MPSLRRVPHTLLLSHTLAHRHTALGSRWAQQRDSRTTHGWRLYLCVRTMWRNVRPRGSLINHYSTGSQNNYRQTLCVLLKSHTNTFFFLLLSELHLAHTHKVDIMCCSVPASCRAADLHIISIPPQYMQSATDGSALL